MNNIGITTVDSNGSKDDFELAAIEVMIHAFHTMGFGSLQDYFNCLPGFSENDELKFYNDDIFNFKLYFNDNSRRNFFHVLLLRRGYAEELMDINLLVKTSTDGTEGLMFNIQPTLEECRMCCGMKIKWNKEVKEKFFFCSDWGFEEKNDLGEMT